LFSRVAERRPCVLRVRLSGAAVGGRTRRHTGRQRVRVEAPFELAADVVPGEFNGILHVLDVVLLQLIGDRRPFDDRRRAGGELVAGQGGARPVDAGEPGFESADGVGGRKLRDRRVRILLMAAAEDAERDVAAARIVDLGALECRGHGPDGEVGKTCIENVHLGDVQRADDIVVTEHFGIFRAHARFDITVERFLGDEGAARDNEFLNTFKVVQRAGVASEIEPRGEKPPVFADLGKFEIQHAVCPDSHTP
jgi:hypothetical protein